jgi:transketolase
MATSAPLPINFPTLRCLEQIRNGICYHDADGSRRIGGGFSYGALGAPHHATEDLAILRRSPGDCPVSGDRRAAEH